MKKELDEHKKALEYYFEPESEPEEESLEVHDKSQPWKIGLFLAFFLGFVYVSAKIVSLLARIVENTK